MAERISYQDIPWSPIATIPEIVPPNLTLPLSAGSVAERTHGRSGDLLVVQLRSDVNEKRKTRATLRSLGLKGVGSQSLRSRSDDNILGYIERVRHLIAVIELDGVQWKSTTKTSRVSSMQYEVIKYGNNTRPGGLYRSIDGDYFDFVSDRDGLRTTWSTSLGALACVRAAIDSHSIPAGSFSGRSILVLDRGDEISASLDSGQTGDFDDLVRSIRSEDSTEVQIATPGTALELPTQEALSVIERAEAHLAMVNVAVGGLRVTWQKPRARFIDTDVELSEAGAYYRSPDFDGLRRFCRSTAAKGFFNGIDVEVQVRENGVAKRVKI